MPLCYVLERSMSRSVLIAVMRISVLGLKRRGVGHSRTHPERSDQQSMLLYISTWTPSVPLGSKVSKCRVWRESVEGIITLVWGRDLVFGYLDPKGYVQQRPRTFKSARHQAIILHPEGPSTQYLRFLVPKTIPLIVYFETRVPK